MPSPSPSPTIIETIYLHANDDELEDEDLDQQAKWISRGFRFGALARGRDLAFRVTVARRAWFALPRRQQNYEVWTQLVLSNFRLLVLPGDGTCCPVAAKATADIILEGWRADKKMVCLPGLANEPGPSGYVNGVDYTKIVGIDPVDPFEPWAPRRLHLAQFLVPF